MKFQKNFQKKANNSKKRNTKKYAHRPCRKHLHTVAKVHTVATILFLGFYCSFAFVFGPKVLWEDTQNKYETAKAAMNTSIQVAVTAYIAGPPGKPVITDIFTGCSSGNPFVKIDWSATKDTDKYDVYRNNDILIRNITNLYFYDNFAQGGQNCSYRVMAMGIRGGTSSNEKFITTNNCYQPSPSPPPSPPSPPAPVLPLLQQMIINGQPISLDTPSMPNTNKKRPSFSGITSIPNARVRLEYSSNKKKFVINLTSNNNGYWYIKKIPKKLKRGVYDFYLSVVDPNDNSQLQSYLLNLRIGKEKKSSKSKKKVGIAYFKEVNYIPSNLFLAAAYPFELAKQNKNLKSDIAYLGNGLMGQVSLAEIQDMSQSDHVVNYAIVNSEKKIDLKNTLASATTDLREKIINSNEKSLSSLPFSLRLPYWLETGKYILRVTVSDKNTALINEIPLEIKESPLLVLGNGATLTCSNLINYTGWIALIVFITLVLSLMLVLIEYHLSKEAPLQVSEEELRELL